MDDPYTIALDGTLVMGTVVAVLSLYALASRWLSDRGQGRAARLRLRMQQALSDYLEAQLSFAETAQVLSIDRPLALGMLLSVANARGIAVQHLLHPLFEHFEFERAELHALGKRDIGRRIRAANHLGYIGGRATVPALLGALQDEQLEVRLAAAQSLVQMGRVDAVLPILEALTLPGRWAQQRATDLLYRMGPAAVPTLQQFLAGSHTQATPGMRVVAINAIGMLSAHTAPSTICDSLASDDREIRVAAARALGGIGDPAAIGRLIDALGDSAWEVRSQVAKSLGKLALGSSRAEAVIPTLERALSDAAWWVRYNAAQALAQMGTSGLDTLQRALTMQTDPFARDISRQMLQERSLLPATLPT